MRVDVRKEQNATSLGLVNSILEKGEFVPSPNIALREDSEHDLGEMTPYEKAIYSASVLIHDKNQDMHNRAKANHKKVDKLQESLNKREHSALFGLLMASINHRLGKESMQFNGLGIRTGYKIAGLVVNIPEELVELLAEAVYRKMIDDEDDDDCVGDLEGNCGACLIYDQCPNPFKETIN